MKKNIIILFSLIGMLNNSNAQENASWYNQNKTSNTIGVSADKVYEEFKNRKTETIIVAVIDNGVDINHEDLKNQIWINDDEIPNNNIDDDNNGYIDDINGWNFLGNAKGEMIEGATLESTRIYVSLNEKFNNKNIEEIDKEEIVDYELYNEVKQDVEKHVEDASKNLAYFDQILNVWNTAESILYNYTKNKDINLSTLDTISSNDEKVKMAVEFFYTIINDNISRKDLEDAKNHFQSQIDYNYNTTLSIRSQFNIPLNDTSKHYYGNNNVYTNNSGHGTHVAGIIAAEHNDIGIDGVAIDVKIMALRAVPDGDEYDLDVANAIRYAVDNGARIINCSFGKKYSPLKYYVNEAIKYAEEKGVLIVKAAGNSSENIDIDVHYPTDKKENKKTPYSNNVITVGASSNKADLLLPAEFSNYGKRNVDIFAPGVAINSTVPNNGYSIKSGTSMASPVVAGCAALILSYYPELTVFELKETILKSGTNYKKLKVYTPSNSNEATEIKFKKLSNTGYVIDVYNALQLLEK